jgi:hypothetical protein
MSSSEFDPTAMMNTEKLNFLITQMAAMIDQQTLILAQIAILQWLAGLP